MCQYFRYHNIQTNFLWISENKRINVNSACHNNARNFTDYTSSFVHKFCSCGLFTISCKMFEMQLLIVYIVEIFEVGLLQSVYNFVIQSALGIARSAYIFGRPTIFLLGNYK